jgi:hypothetical protein
MNLELVDRRQTVIADGRRGRKGWRHGVHQQRWTPESNQEVMEPDCPILFDALLPETINFTAKQE